MPRSEDENAQLLAFGRSVGRIRRQRSMSVDALATASGIAGERVGALERGALDPTYEEMLAIADGLEVDLAALLALAEELEAADDP